MTTNTLHELTPETKIWGCPRCDRVGVSITTNEVVVQCPTPDCSFKWIIKNVTFKDAVIAWNRLIINQTKEISGGWGNLRC